MESLQVVKSEIIRLLRQINNPNWQSFHLIIEAPPFINQGFTANPVFLDKDEHILNISWMGDHAYVQKVLELIFQMNQNQQRNQIIFFTRRDDYKNASIFISFSQDIEDAFESRLPRSKKGKTIPWFKVY